ILASALVDHVGKSCVEFGELRSHLAQKEGDFAGPCIASVDINFANLFGCHRWSPQHTLYVWTGISKLIYPVSTWSKHQLIGIGVIHGENDSLLCLWQLRQHVIQLGGEADDFLFQLGDEMLVIPALHSA